MRFHLAIIALIAVLATLIYGQTARFDFVNYDDPFYITQNPKIVEGLTLESIIWAFTTTHYANWIPVTWLSYLADASLFGTGPAGFHIMNVLWHALAGILLYRVLLLYAGNRNLAGFTAVLFVIHPMHVESVAWISERKDVLSAAFGFATLWAYHRYANKSGLILYLLTLALYACSLMAKPMLVTLSVILLILDWKPLNRFQQRADAKKLLLEKLPFLALALADTAITIAAQSAASAIQGAGSIPLAYRALNAIHAYAVYLGKFIVPYPLIPFYPHPGADLELWKPIIAFFVLVAISILCWRLRKQAPECAACWGIFLVLLLPVIGFIQAGGQAMADRYAYLPYVPLTLLTVFFTRELIQRAPRIKTLAVVLTGVWSVALGITAFAQTARWQDSITLFEHTLRHSPENTIALLQLAQAHLDQNNPEDALRYSTLALEQSPNSAHVLFVVGKASRASGNTEDALQYLQAAIQRDPAIAESHNQLGQTLLDAGRVAEAETSLRNAIDLDPNHAEAHNNLGNALLRQNRFDEAAVSFQASLEINPLRAETWSNLGASYLVQGQNAEATEALQRSLDLDPDNAVALVNYAVTRMNDGELDKALEIAERAVALDPTYSQGQQLLQHLRQQKASGQ